MMSSMTVPGVGRLKGTVGKPVQPSLSRSLDAQLPQRVQLLRRELVAHRPGDRDPTPSFTITGLPMPADRDRLTARRGTDRPAPSRSTRWVRASGVYPPTPARFRSGAGVHGALGRGRTGGGQCPATVPPAASGREPAQRPVGADGGKAAQRPRAVSGDDAPSAGSGCDLTRPYDRSPCCPAGRSTPAVGSAKL